MTVTTLEDIARPVIYPVAQVDALGLVPAADRHGQSIRTWIRSLEGIQKEGVTHSRLTGRAWRFASDEGAHLGGRNVAPNPLSFVGVGMAGSFMTELLALAKTRGIALGKPVLVVENFYYRDGSFPRGTMVSSALPPEVSFDCQSSASKTSIQQLVLDAIAAAPVNGLVRDEKISLFSLTHNGVQIAPEKVAALPADALPDPGDPIASLSPAAGSDKDQPLAKITLSEEEMAARIAADPPAGPVLDGEKKLLHLRTICRLRPDGTYECLREQYKECSSSWVFVVDDRADAANAIAPDSCSYFAIGLAFCFMTQIGRYAHMAKLPVAAYRVVQDLHFTKGGASSGTGQWGTGDPVETHVYMDTQTDDATVREVVRIAEATCFLHALCRDKAKVKMRHVPIAL